MLFIAFVSKMNGVSMLKKKFWLCSYKATNSLLHLTGLSIVKEIITQSPVVISYNLFAKEVLNLIVNLVCIIISKHDKKAKEVWK